MDATTIISSLLTLFAGIGLFLIACDMLSSNLESISSGKLKSLFAKTSDNKLLGVGIGTVATIAINSSGAVTVMIIGFVNAGIISLVQAATLIYGANIGTTLTAQIVALGLLSGDGLSTSVIFAALTGVGAFMIVFFKKDSIVTLGGILSGLGMVFIALGMMSGAMDVFAESEMLKVFLAAITNPILLVVIGAIITAIIQSSTAVTTIAITMLAAGLITLDQGIFITMGSNIGTCAVALLAGMTSEKNAKRTSLIHLFFNVGGTVIFMVVGFLLQLFTGGDLSFGILLAKLFPGVPQTQLAMFHTFFNVITVVFALPLTEALVKLVTKIVPDGKDDGKHKDGLRLFYIDDLMLSTPAIAVQQVKKEIINMADIAIDNFNRSLNIVCSLDFTEKKAFLHHEKELNFLNEEILKYIVKLSQAQLSERDHQYLTGAIHTVSDLERVGDYAKNIVEYAELLEESGKGFSSKAIEEINTLKEMMKTLYTQTVKAYEDEDEALMEAAYQTEDQIDAFTEQMSENHVKRLGDGTCTPTEGAQYLSLTANAERIADHFINMVATIKDLK